MGEHQQDSAVWGGRDRVPVVGSQTPPVPSADAVATTWHMSIVHKSCPEHDVLSKPCRMVCFPDRRGQSRAAFTLAWFWCVVLTAFLPLVVRALDVVVIPYVHMIPPLRSPEHLPIWSPCTRSNALVVPSKQAPAFPC